MDISVIIATRNRGRNLGMTLNSLDKTVVPDGLDWEVIIVDNGSTDATYDICKSFADRNPERFIYAYEPKKGKSIALNTGIRNARGKILAFTDDDCIVDINWISSIAKEFNYSPVAAVGGRVELYNATDRDMSTVYHKVRERISGLGQLFPPLIIGCNMAIKKDILCDIGCFDPLLGPGSSYGAISEDVDVIYRIIKRGHRVVFSPDILVLHNHGRKKEDEIIDLVKGYFKGQGAFYAKHIMRMDICASLFKSVYNAIKTLLKGFITREDFPYHRIFLPSLFAGWFYYQKMRLKGSRLIAEVK